MFEADPTLPSLFGSLAQNHARGPGTNGQQPPQWPSAFRSADLSSVRGAIVKAAVYEGPRSVTVTVSVSDMPDAKIEHPCDILVVITTANICGFDLHMYEGRTSIETGRSMGHENLGEVVEMAPPSAR